MKKLFLIAIVAATMLSSCSSYTATGAMFGGAIGSAVGGITGGYRGHDVGALVGMAAGAVVGAAAEAKQQEAYERRVRAAYDDVYYGDEGVYRDVAKAKRVQSYHNKVKNRGSRRGYGNKRGNYSDDAYDTPSSRAAYGTPTGGNGFHLEAAQDPMSGAVGTTTTVTPQQEDNKSGYTSDDKYDDRIEMK